MSSETGRSQRQLTAGGSIHEKFDVFEVLGSGSSGTVFRATRKMDGEEVAIKNIRKVAAGSSADERARLEHRLNARASAIRSCRSVLVPLADTKLWEDEESHSLVFELMRGGNLADHTDRTSEVDVKAAMFNVFSAIAGLHSAGIAHCDVKLANIVLGIPGEYSSARLGDLGQAHDTRLSRAIRNPAGTPSYMSPECIRVAVCGGWLHSYGKEVDLWAAGVALCELLSGTKPFSADNAEQIFAQSCSAPLNMTGAAWDGVSDEARDLVRRCLDRRPDKRITAKQALDHSWFKDIATHRSHSWRSLIPRLLMRTRRRSTAAG
jgi:calcium-dependent protein kinase